MEYFTRVCKWPSFLLAIGLMVFCGCGKVDYVENVAAKQESFVRTAAVEVVGQVLNPENKLPISGALVKTSSFSTTTDTNGRFRALANNFGDSEAVTVSKDGHINYEFVVDYTGFDNNATFSWLIYLPEQEGCVWVGPNEGAWYRFTANAVEYIVDIRRGSVDEWTNVCVSQGGLAFGRGISSAFGLLGGIDVETPNTAGGVVLNTALDVRLDLQALLLNYPSAPAGTATNLAQTAAAAGSTTAELANIIFGLDPTLVNSGNSAAGLFIINSFLPGTIIPGVGAIFNNAFFCAAAVENPSNASSCGGGSVNIDDPSLGIIGLAGAIDLNDNPIEVQGIPHQSVGDGGG